MPPEKRKQKRVILQRPVLINKGIKVMGLDLSEGGIYVHTGRHFSPGSIVDVKLPLGQTNIELKARVRHSQEGVGMGLMFVDMGSREKDALRALINQLAAKRAGTPADAKKTILIMDSNPSQRRMYKSKLVLDGYGVIEAGDGFSALDALTGEKIALILMDLNMPDMGGFEAISRIRNKWKAIPIMVFSSRPAPSDMEKALAAGATEFLVKMTTSPAKLSERIKMYLK